MQQEGQYIRDDVVRYQSVSWRGKVRREKERDVGGDSSMEIKWRVGGGCIRMYV